MKLRRAVKAMAYRVCGWYDEPKFWKATQDDNDCGEEPCYIVPAKLWEEMVEMKKDHEMLDTIVRFLAEGSECILIAYKMAVKYLEQRKNK